MAPTTRSIKVLSSAGPLAALLLLKTACVVEVPAACPPQVVWGPPPAAFAPPPAPAPPAAPPAAAPPAERTKVAVLPINEEHLFREERADLRSALANKLTSLATNFIILPLAEVDAELRPLSATTGARCAFEGEPATRRARDQGWFTTDLLHVSGWKDKPEELWVHILGANHYEAATWTARWDARLGLLDRYRAAFAALAPGEGGALLGGLAASGSDQGALREGPISVCETRAFSACDASSAAWKDKAGELAGCFAGEDEVVTEVLIDGAGAAPRCEIANLNALDGREGPREACLCRALTASSAFRAKAGRRIVRVGFEATDLAGKPRPELRVVEASTNLDTEVDYHNIRSTREGKVSYTSVRRLLVDNLDGLAAPLARCAAPDGRVAVAEIEVREDGVVIGTRMLTGPLKAPEAACIDKSLRRGAFTCTSDGKAARVRIGMAWPERAR